MYMYTCIYMCICILKNRCICITYVYTYMCICIFKNMCICIIYVYTYMRYYDTIIH